MNLLTTKRHVLYYTYIFTGFLQYKKEHVLGKKSITFAIREVRVLCRENHQNK